MVIAIDGYASSGKSKLASMLSKTLGINVLNTGMIFRALGYFFEKNGISVSSLKDIQESLKSIKINVVFKNNEQYIDINNTLLREELFSSKCSMLASKYSTVQNVRDVVERLQKDFAEHNNVIVEGRDIGTVVFPDAKYKFFVTASILVRTERRYQSLLEQGSTLSFDEVMQSLKDRDYADENRSISPLKKAVDAVVIDTSNDTPAESLNKFLQVIKEV